MELHDPAQSGVLSSAVEQQEGLVSLDLFLCQRLPVHGLPESCIDAALGKQAEHYIVQTVIGGTAAVGIEIASIIGGLGMFIITPNNTGLDLIIYILCQLVYALGLGICSTVSWTMMGDAIDYNEWKFGTREEGTVYSEASGAF